MSSCGLVVGRWCTKWLWNVNLGKCSYNIVLSLPDSFHGYDYEAGGQGSKHCQQHQEPHVPGCHGKLRRKVPLAFSLLRDDHISTHINIHELIYLFARIDSSSCIIIGMDHISETPSWPRMSLSSIPQSTLAVSLAQDDQISTHNNLHELIYLITQIR